MAIPHAEKLIARARTGERLATKERRHALTYLLATEPDNTNVELGELFLVSERQIRLDKVYIREERAKLVKEDDVALVIADIAMNFDRQLRDIEAGKRALEKTTKGKGSRTYLEYCKAIFNMELQKVKALQDLGYYPKNLGNMTVQKFEYTASVSVMEGEAGMRPATITARDDGALDAEFSEIEVTGNEPALLPAPEGVRP